MRRLGLLFILAFLSVSAHAQWTLYYSQTATVNGDGSATVTPTVSIVGDDGGYCSPDDQNFGVDTPALMLNGNYWQFGDSIQSGTTGGSGYTIDFAYTFPNVTLPSNGTSVDMSYAAKVHGVCYGHHNGAWPPFTFDNFYDYYFVDGTYPSIYPSPCWIIDNSPVCALPWPALWSSVPPPGIQRDLDSQMAGLSVGMSVTTYKYASVASGTCTYNVSCGSVTPTCGNAPLLTSAPCPSEYIIGDWLVWRRGSSKTCFVAGLGATSSSPAPCT